MSDLALQVQDLSKRYTLGTTTTGSFRQDLNYLWKKRILKKHDPFYQHDEEKNARQVWALKDINFDIRQGEVWGFAGSNGAGKSTLLKIISKIVKPTTGFVRGRGVISSLLEVGTGFHEELSGRENIFLSGYLLGMKKQDIKNNFDAIVAFSGIEKFIDTPVKRYSSGMYVRLAFAVAAYLEPDILIVDEVLAVGDAEFQKKCLGKMNEVSVQKGRTILFVSHNMQAVKQLCQKAIWLHGGRQKAVGPVNEVVSQYVNSVQKFQLGRQWEAGRAPGNEWVLMEEVTLTPHLANEEDVIDVRTPFTFATRFVNQVEGAELNVVLRLFSYGGECIFELSTRPSSFAKGPIEARCGIPGNLLNDGAYYLSIFIILEKSKPVVSLEECISFDVADYREGINLYGKWMGAVRPSLPFTIQQVV